MIGPYLISTVTLRQYKGADQYGEPNATTDVAVKARVLYKEKALQGVGQAFVVSAVQVLMRDREIITDGFATRDADTISYMDVVVVDGVVRQIAQIGKQADFSIRYMEVYLK